jgi:acetyl-CoA carboxylase biotin carboxyl carrier protein
MKKTKSAAKALSKLGGLATGRARVSAGDVDLELVRDLARIATEHDLAELEIEPTGRIRISRRQAGGGGAPSQAPFPFVHAGAAAPAPSAAPSAADTKDKDALFVLSPFVGTFYRAPSPDAQPFADVGQTIRKGQVVCIIEAMKLMNEIESEVDGKVTEVLVKNGEHVEYGQQLFRLQKA